MADKYLVLIEQYETSLKNDKSVFSLIGYAKLFFVLLIGILAFFIYRSGFDPVLSILFAAALITSAALWIYHIKLHEKIDYSKGMINICNCYIDRISGKWAAFKDTGAEFANAEHMYARDLDVAGEKSMFQFLNTTNTWHGRLAFANDLLQPAYGRTELQERQEAIAELSTEIDFACQIQYHLSGIGVNSSALGLVSALKDISCFIKRKALRIFLIFMPVITSIFLAWMIIFQQKSLYLTGAAIVIAQALIWVLGISKTNRYFGGIAGLPYKLDSYAAAIKILLSRNFTSSKLRQIQLQLTMAEQSIRDLNRIVDKINVKRSGIVYFVVNILLLWDYECAFLLEGWKKKYSGSVERWFESLGEFESLLSLSNLPNVCKHTCLPVFTDSYKIIKAKDIGHPLLPNDNRVTNDFSCNNNIFIISGSNMSGKTTFLRTIGINMVLARAGGFVCANSMSLPLVQIITSMRITDDLNEGVSTFYAELKRIKAVIELAANENTLFLIDEIFKGTNSVDRLTGAAAVISKLDELGSIGIVSTHDPELCELATNHPRIINYSFSEHYESNRICFSYKMKHGKSTTTNAKYLMEMVGIM